MGILLQNVSKTFGPVSALAGVDETIADGSLVALLGPSGCGKTTLLRIIAGLEYPDHGRVYVDDLDVTDIPLRKRNVGFVFQGYALFPHLDVASNIAFGPSVRGHHKARTAQRVDELLNLVQLDGYHRRKPHQLSGGQKQRVALARALAGEPSILLLDEPFAALDLKVRKELRSWLRSLHEQTHVTTVIVTHDAEEAMEIADKIILLEHGRVQQTGTPYALYHQPANPFVMQFLGAVNVIRDRGSDMYVRPHELAIELQPSPDSLPATVERVINLGATARVECRLNDGQHVTIELADRRASELRLNVAQHVFLSPTTTRPFASTHTREEPLESFVA